MKTAPVIHPPTDPSTDPSTCRGSVIRAAVLGIAWTASATACSVHDDPEPSPAHALRRATEGAEGAEGAEGMDPAECSSPQLDQAHVECSALHPEDQGLGYWTCPEAQCVWEPITLTPPEVGMHPDGTLCLTEGALAELTELPGFAAEEDAFSYEEQTEEGDLFVTGPLIVGDTSYCFLPTDPEGSGESTGGGGSGSSGSYEDDGGYETGDLTTGSEPPWQCGPDMTARTLEVMQNIIQDFNAPGANRDDACWNLIDPRTGGAAWDIYPFFPGPDCSPGGDPGDLASDSGCGIPCWPCASGVQFYGQCVNYQVLNYVFWGVAMELCDNKRTMRFLRYVRSLGSQHSDAQGNAIAIGRVFATSTSAGLGADSRSKAVQNTFMGAKKVWGALAEDQCETTCTYVWPQRLYYSWRGLR